MNRPKAINKIFIFGNLAGGKSTLARKLAEKTGLPLLHMDSIQFDSNLELLPRNQIKQKLDAFQNRGRWIIDGFGPFEWIEPRMKDADLVIYVDLPFWRHRWWFLKRVIQTVFRPRAELPKEAKELKFAHIKKAWTQLSAIEKKMNPQLRKILKRAEFEGRVLHIRGPKDLRAVVDQVIV